MHSAGKFEPRTVDSEKESFLRVSQVHTSSCTVLSLYLTEEGCEEKN